ncbi:MAG TPA: hypothetical protein VK147_04605 [Candidatus Didemnitutus sp.]|nr:hypothetical protein [Candidatus Didemnitutus sp.]
MTRFFDHIRPLLAGIAISAMILTLGYAPAIADKAKKAASSKSVTAKERTAKAATTYASPINGAVSTTIRVLGNQRTPNTSKQSTKVNVGADTSRRDNKFIFARAASDVFTTRIELSDDQGSIDIGIYNMLGKKVMDVYRGYASRGQHDYTQPIPDLPEGVYICIMQGSDFRKAEKFFFSR